MRLFTDPVISKCNPFLWRLQLVWHPVALVVLLAAYQGLNVLMHGFRFLTSAQLQECIHLWLQATCWLGLVAPAGLLAWVFGGFLYRQTECRIFSPEHCSNTAWHAVSLAGVSFRCAFGAFVAAHLYPTLWCLWSGVAPASLSWLFPDACWRGDCDIASRLEVWLAFAVAASGLCVLAMHWCSWWLLQPLWRGAGPPQGRDGLRLAWSLLAPAAGLLAALLLLDPSSGLEHALLVAACFAFVACAGTWSRWLRQRPWGWLPPLLTAVTAAVLALALSIRARDWYYSSWGLEERRERALGEQHCSTLHWHREWLAWVRRLDEDAGRLAARKVRSLMVCAVSLPACLLAFLSAVQSRDNRFSQDRVGCHHASLGLLAALLGFGLSAALTREPPHLLAVKLLRWLALDALGIAAAGALGAAGARAHGGSARCWLCRGCAACACLAVALLCAALAAALLLGGLDYSRLLRGRDVRIFMRSNTRLEATHIMLFIVVMLMLSYLARSAYWRRHWSKRWEMTPLDHQGLCGSQRLSLFPSSRVQPQWAYDEVTSPKEDDALASDDFWQRKQRLVSGTRARMLHLSMPLVGLTCWQKLRLCRQSLALTVQATTSAVWRYLDRLGEVKGFSPPVVAPSQVLGLWLPGAFARGFRLLIIIFLWYSQELPITSGGSPSPTEEGAANELRSMFSRPVQQDVEELDESASHFWGYAAARAAHMLDKGAAGVWRCAASGAAQLLGTEGGDAADWFLRLSLPYRCALAANVLLSLTLALCWRALGLFSALDAVMQAAVVLLDSDCQCRKIVLLRDGTLSPKVKIAWLLVTVTMQCVLPLRTMIVSRYWLNPCSLLDVLLQEGLVPSSAHMLAVSATDMKDGLTYNSMLLDGQFTQSVALAISSALSVLGNSGATLTDICLFALQILFKSIKGPLDVHSLRLLRLGALCDAIHNQREGKLTTVWNIQPGQCARRFVGVEAVRGTDMEATSWIQMPEELRPEDSVRDDTGWSVSFTEVPVRLGWLRTERRLAAHITIPEESLWGVWTLQIEGRHTWFRRQDEGPRSLSSEDGRLPRSHSGESGRLARSHSGESGRLPRSHSGESGRLARSHSGEGGRLARSHSGEGGRLARGHSGEGSRLTPKAKVPPPPPSMEGQWVRWYPQEVPASAKDVFRVEGTDLLRPKAEGRESLVPQGEHRYAVHSSTGSWTGRVIEANDWGLLRMSDGTKWVRSGPQALMQGMMYNDIRVWTSYDSFSDSTAVLTFQWRARTVRLSLKGHWLEDFHKFELRKKNRVNFGRDAFTVEYLRFRPGAILVFVHYDHTIRPVSWTMLPAAEKVETVFSQTFTGESTGGQDWRLPAAFYPSWWWARLRCRDWSPPREGHACMADTRDHPRFDYHKGPGRLISHHDPEAREAVGRRDAFRSSRFLGNDMVEVERVTLVLHACARKFRAPTCCEAMDPLGRCYAAAAESEGYVDGLEALKSPSELHAQLWPDVERSAELSDDGAAGYAQVGSLVLSSEEDPAAQGPQKRALADA